MKKFKPRHLKSQLNRGSLSSSLFIVIAGIILFFVFGKLLFPKLFNKEFVIEEDVGVDRYYLTLTKSDSLTSDWEPSQKPHDFENAPEIVGVSALLVDINTGRVLYEKNSSEKRPIASLVKIMTAVVALEHKNKDEEIIVSKKASEIGENVMGISEGEIYTLEELLYGLMLNSGNDAAYAIAEGVAGDVDTFIEWMNIKAEELNLKDSYFGGPSGLFEGTVSTSIDLVKLSRYAMQSDTFRKIVKTYELELPYSNKHKYLYLWNQTNLLTTYPGVEGIKTGYTDEAGLCLVTYARNEDVELVGVVLNSIDRKGDMILMLDYGFQLLGITIEHHLLDY